MSRSDLKCLTPQNTRRNANATLLDGTDDVASTSWANIESNIAILCACLPMFRRPLVLLFPRLFSSLMHHSMPSVQGGQGQGEQGKHRMLSHAGVNGSEWMDDGLDKRADLHAGHPSTVMKETSARGRGRGSEEFTLEHVEDVKQ